MAVAPVDRQATLALARSVRRLIVKAGAGIVRMDRTDASLTDEDAARYLVHEDGFLRVPVLVLGDTLVRGYTEDLYRAVLDEAAPRP